MKYHNDCIECDWSSTGDKVVICPMCCSTNIEHSKMTKFETENDGDVFDGGEDE